MKLSIVHGFGCNNNKKFQGRFHGWLSSFLGDIEFAEAEAVLQGIKLATDSSFFPLIVESNSINTVQESYQSQKEIEWIISESRSLVDKLKVRT
ncbi:hypothetical protein WN943_025780 [Citrus x changshan-huyou]